MAEISDDPVMAAARDRFPNSPDSRLHDQDAELRMAFRAGADWQARRTADTAPGDEVEAVGRVKVYTASKLAHAQKWRELDWPEVAFTAHWPSYSGFPADDHRHVADSPENARRFWVEDEEDVRSADVVLVYAEAGEHLRGALVEAGMGIAAGKLVIVVGGHPDYGTWQYHPKVLRVATLDDARAALRRIPSRAGVGVRIQALEEAAEFCDELADATNDTTEFGAGARGALWNAAESLRAKAAALAPTEPATTGEAVLTLADALALWREHGGMTFGPHVEHVSMAESSFLGFCKALAALHPPAGIETGVTEAMVEAAEEAVYGRHERGFIMRPLIDPIDMRAALTAALSRNGPVASS